MAKFRKGDLVTGATYMRKYDSYKAIYEIVEPNGPANYGDPTIVIKAITPVEYYETLQYEHHFELIEHAAKVLYANKA